MATRKYTPESVTSECKQCHTLFSYLHTTGTPKLHCSSDCRKRYQIGNRPALLALKAKCSVPGCGNKATRVSSGMCETHYYRMRRTGSTDKARPKYRYENRGYLKVLIPAHELAGKDGCVPEHRLVMHAAHKGRCQPCFWCGVPLTWDDAVIDHLNEIKGDNAIGNLVTSCNNCNRARGAMLPFLRGMRPDALPVFIERAKAQALLSH
ncbi:MAG: HNH endonuclease [Burkholderiales bacterium]